MIGDRKVSRRYAEAIFSLARDEGRLEQFQEDIIYHQAVFAITPLLVVSAAYRLGQTENVGVSFLGRIDVIAGNGDGPETAEHGPSFQLLNLRTPVKAMRVLFNHTVKGGLPKRPNSQSTPCV